MSQEAGVQWHQNKFNSLQLLIEFGNKWKHKFELMLDSRNESSFTSDGGSVP